MFFSSLFFKKGLSFLMKNWQMLLIVSFLAFVYYLHQVKIPSLEQEITELKFKVSMCEFNNNTLKGSISQFNNQISNWKSVSEDLQKRNDKLTNELIKMRNSVNIKAAEVLNIKTPKTCQDSIDLLKNIGDLQW